MKNLLSTPPSEAYFLVRFLYASKDIEGSETVEMFESMEFSVIEKYFFQPEYPRHANKFFIKKLRTIVFFYIFSCGSWQEKSVPKYDFWLTESNS